MKINAENATLQLINPSRIDRNPENPRIFFRLNELVQLQESIRKHGVQVPIAVYKDGRRYVLIDGERRWRCCLKLNKDVIPALVQPKPDRLTNLLLMFNIHALREQWDLLTIAMKMPEVEDRLHEQLGRKAKERELAEQTGLKIGVLRRCKLLRDLPTHYRDMLLAELKKPKAQQKLTEDFFIEMEKALKTVGNLIPEVIVDVDEVRRVLIDKFKSGVIQNRVDFRDLPKIARADRVAVSKEEAVKALRNVFARNTVSIKDAFSASVSEAYAEMDVIGRLNKLLERLEKLEEPSLPAEIREKLREVVERATRLLEGN